jgi:hypothetical protein
MQLAPIANPVGSRLLPISQAVTYVSGLDTCGIGAARGIRTPDPIITNDVLYQLSYCGVRPDGRLNGS